MPTIDIKQVGNRIKLIRTEHLIPRQTQAEFAKLLIPPVNRSAVKNWENGMNLPNRDRLKQIAELGSVSTDYLLFGKQLSGYGERIRIIRENQLKLNKVEFSKIFGDPLISDETIEAWEDENALPTKKHLEMIARMGDSSVDEILWNEKPSKSIKIVKKADSELDALNLSDEKQFMSEILLSRFITIRKLVADDVIHSAIVRDILDSIIEGLVLTPDTSIKDREKLIDAITKEYKKIINIHDK